MERWQWQGQSQGDWPRWLVVKTFARSTGRITLPSPEGDLVVDPGDWIIRRSDGRILVRKPDPSWDERHFRALRDTF